jgi:integrase
MRTTIEVRFKLKPQTNADGTRSIQAKCYLNAERLVIGTGLSIDPGKWNFDEEAPKGNKVIAKAIHTIESNIKKAFNTVLDCGDPLTVANVRKRYDELTGKKRRGGLTLFECIDAHIERAKNGQLKNRRGKPYSDGIAKVYSVCKNHLIAYAETIGKKELNFDDVLNKDFYGSFTKFLQTTERPYKTKLGATRAAGKLNANSIGGVIVRLKTFLNASTEHFSSRFNYSKEWKVNSTPQRKVYLTREELEKIERLDLSSDPKLEEIREWLLITCWTGLRVSDFKRLRPEHFNFQNNSIIIDAQKTDQPSYIPIFLPVKRIIERHKAQGGFLPRPYANEYLNREFKNIAFLAGLTQKVITMQTVGNKTIEVTVPKYSLISTKTGRTSLISNLLSMGFSREKIKLITGHRSDVVFAGYNSISGEENATAVLKEFEQKTGILKAV